MKTLEQINALLEVLDSDNQPLIEQLKQLKADLEKPKGGIYVPKEGGTYHYVTRVGEAVSMVHNGHGIDEAIIANQIVYRTHEEALRARDKQAAEVRYVCLIAEANEGWWPDWEDCEQEKWFVSIIQSDIDIHHLESLKHKHSCYYAKSKEAAQWAVNQLTSDEIELIFKS